MRVIVFILIVSLANCFALSADPVEIPEILYRVGSGGEGEPAWVSARAATSEDGSIAWDVVGPNFKRFYEGILSNRQHYLNSDDPGERAHHKSIEVSSPECLNLADYVAPMNRASKAQCNADFFIGDSYLVLQGVVETIDYGFRHGSPGSLLAVRVTKQVFSDSDTSIFPVVLLFYYNGEFSVGDQRFCLKHSQNPYLPSVGDSLTAFIHLSPDDESRRMYLPHEIVFFSADGQIHGTPNMLNDPRIGNAKSQYQIEQYALEIMAKGPNEEKGDIWKDDSDQRSQVPGS